MSLRLVASLLALVTSSGVLATCITGGAPIKLPTTFRDETSGAMCPRGFYCPNSNVSDPSSYPVICPPTADCFATRFANELCEPQGTYEPMPCPPGYYCPTPLERHRCPSGHYCTIGTTDPHSCDPMSHCPEGTEFEQFYGSILLCFVADVVVVCVWFAYRKWHQILASRPNPVDKDAAAEAVTEAFLRSRQVEELDFSFQDLKLDIPMKDKTTKTVLSGVTATISPGKVTAIMGPSGSGKTSLLNVLRGSVDPSWSQSGTFTINGVAEKNTAAYKKVIGFVPQDDVLHTELTVADNIQFTSEIRLPTNWTFDEREKLRGALYHVLDIDRIKNSSVNQVSGGQRKRASIAMELATAPVAVFLDEPTSGLDATTSLMLCRILKDIARATNITVAMVIHQPRHEIWDELDEVVLLAPGGRTVFQGPQSEVKQYFETNMGVHFGGKNPADLVMDKIQESADTCVDFWASNAEHWVANHASPSRRLRPMVLGGPEPEITTYRNRSAVGRGANFMNQVFLCHNRGVRKQLVHIRELVVETIVGIIGCAMMGIVSKGHHYRGLLHPPLEALSPSPDEATIGRVCMMYMIAIASSSASSGIKTFGGEISVYWREASSGHSKLAYFLGNGLSILYRVIVSSLHFTTVATLLWNDVVPFGRFFLVLFLVHLAVYGQSSLLGMVLRPDTAPLMASIVAVFFGLLNGFPGLPRPLLYISYAYYATIAIWNEATEPYLHVFQVEEISSDIWAYPVGFYGQAVGILVLINVVYRVAAFVLMVALNREKQL